MDSATEFLFGSCVNSLHASLPFPHNVTFATPGSDSARAQVATAFSAAFNESMLHVSNRARIGWAWPMVEMWSDKTVAPMKIVSAYIDPVIREAVEKKKLANSLSSTLEKTVDEVTEDGTLLDELLNVTSGWYFLLASKVDTEALFQILKSSKTKRMSLANLLPYIPLILHLG